MPNGFSFMKDGPSTCGWTDHWPERAEWLARADVDDIAWVLKTFGEERFAKKIARAIVHDRVTEPYAHPPAGGDDRRVNPSKEKARTRPPAASRPSASTSTASWTKLKPPSTARWKCWLLTAVSPSSASTPWKIGW